MASKSPSISRSSVSFSPPPCSHLRRWIPLVWELRRLTTLQNSIHSTPEQCVFVPLRKWFATNAFVYLFFAADNPFSHPCHPQDTSSRFRLLLHITKLLLECIFLSLLPVSLPCSLTLCGITGLLGVILFSPYSTQIPYLTITFSIHSISLLIF